MAQNGADLTIQGRSTTLIALSDFVGNLGTNPLLIKPIEIVNSQVETVPAGRAGARRSTAGRNDSLHGQGTGRARRAAAAPRRQGSDDVQAATPSGMRL